jgi:hypothetical protein
MNNHLHPIFREALRPFSPIDADNVKLGHALPYPQIHRIGAKTEIRESANDGEPAYIRMPELDRRVASGDFSNANAWFETATGRTRYFCVGYLANEGRWLPITERAKENGNG